MNILVFFFWYSVGFDWFDDWLEMVLCLDQFNGYLFYDIIWESDGIYWVVMVVVGFSCVDLDIIVQENLLCISGKLVEEDSEQCIWLYWGIVCCGFECSFWFVDYVQVEGVIMEDGLLIVYLIRVVLEVYKLCQILIGELY